jgi:hypothetical protein
MPEGGDAISTEFGELLLDVMEQGEISLPADVTSHAVELGAPVSDHIRPGQVTVTFTAAVAEVPLESGVDGSTQGDVSLPNGKNASMVQPGDTDRRTEALERLNWLRREGHLVTVTGLSLDLTEYAIRMVRQRTDVDTAGALVVDLELVEFLTVEVEETDAPSPRVERGRSGRDRGRQPAPGTESDPVSGDPADREESVDVLSQAAGALGISR